jgi:lipopolysaccharide transport system ATP-binding protein
VGDDAISAAGLGKRYLIGSQQQAHDRFGEMLFNAVGDLVRGRLGRRPAPARSDDVIWAVKDVSLAIGAGEVVGVVGANGSGKSTLLKLLCRITPPTTGRAVIRGRVGSLLEVGTGFHRDLTGRENVFLNGAILGMRRADIAARFDEIVAFAEVERFIDTPVKRYSSGMHLRLGFAVAAHLDTDVLLVDEVLAVGDAGFQKKCLGKVRLVAHEGRTVLFVSHNMVAVEDLCSRAIWLDHGRIANDGRPRTVIGDYIRTHTAAVPQQIWPDIATAPGNDRVRLKSAGVRRAAGSHADVIDVTTEFLIELEYWQLEAAEAVSISVFVCREDGLIIFNTGTLRPSARTPGVYREIGRVPGNLMNDGFYSINVEIVYGQTCVYRHPNLLAFTIADHPSLRAGWFGEWPGAVRPILDWRSEFVGEITTPGGG